MARHFKEHFGSIFEFPESVSFQPNPADGGAFVSDATGEEVFSTKSHGHYSRHKMQALIDEALAEEQGVVQDAGASHALPVPRG